VTATREPPVEPVWDPPGNFGFADQLRGLGGTVAPVLAGFSLATIAALQTASTGPPLEEWSLVAFASSAVLLLMTMQLSSHALGRSAPPSVRLDWEPLARVDAAELHAARVRQRKDMRTVRVYWRRAGLCYDAGLLSFLTGVLLLLIPEFWSGERVAAVAIAGAALAIELVWAFRTWKTTLQHPFERLRLSKAPPAAGPLAGRALATMLDRRQPPPEAVKGNGAAVGARAASTRP
jgi:hypothetical protein